MRRLACLVSLAALTACSSDPSSPATSGTGGSTSSTSTSTATGTGGSGGGTGGGGAAPTGPVKGTVSHYDYAVDLAQKKAHSKLTIDVEAPGGDCFATSCTAPMVSNATWNGKDAASFSLSGGEMSACGAGVSGGQPLAIEADVELAEKTFFGLDVGLSHQKDMAGGTFRYLLSWVGGCDHFGPCDDDPSRLATFHFDVTHAADEVALCSGTLTPGNGVTQCDLSGTLAPTYSAFAVVTDTLWQKKPYASAAGIDLVFYEVPGGKLAGTLDKDAVTGYLGWITGLLGPFPYGKELRIAGGPTAWLGFEHPANIVMLENLPDLSMAYAAPTQHVFMHEVAHQWAGDRSTILTAPDFVWKEATAEYLSYVYEDEHRPPAEAAASLLYWDSVSLQAKHYPRPTDDPAPAVSAFYGDVYGPGPMVLYVQLEPLIGRDKVLAGIASFLSAPGARSVEDLKKAMEMVSGKSLGAYFDAWVFGKGVPEWPTFSASAEQSGSEVTITVTQQNPSGKVYGCAIEVQVSGATQSAVGLVDFGVEPQSDVATAKVMLAEPLVSTTVDPHHRVIGKTPKPPGPVPPPVPLKVWPL
ncbi:MAG: M1 family aminopeptidase [Byssovorax sp.]